MFLDSVVYLLEIMFADGLFGRCGKSDSSQSVTSMHMLGKFHLAFEEQVRAAIDGDIASAYVI